MALQAAAFWILAAVAVVSAFSVVAARNPVRSVMWLICAFFTSAGLFVLIGAEFLAMLLVVVYVGAVAVLFLFVVMMLDVDFVELNQGFLQYMPFGALVSLILLTELVLVGSTFVFADPDAAGRAAFSAAGPTNAEAIGAVLYDQYIYYFQAAGIVLLIAMIGAIVLTLRHKPGVRRQDVGKQVARRPKDGVELIDVKPGSGI